MKCNSLKKTNKCTNKKVLHKHNNLKKSKKFIQNDLEETGREQFFWHYPNSNLPIRDITKKTEPHIEIGAENYLRPCLQRNIKGFCQSNEKYLFLCTTCRNKDIEKGKFFGKRFIIGYIKKNEYKMMEDRVATIGKIYIIPFNKQLNYNNLNFSRSRGMQCFDAKKTKKLLRIIHSNNNIIKKIIKEMIEKEAIARSNGKSIPIDKKCINNKCEYENKCLRNKMNI